MRLDTLLSGIDVLELHADPALEISDVCYDSRACAPGALFVAISGFAADGHRFIPAALENGACAAIVERPPETPCAYVLVASTRLALAQLGANWFGHPADAMKIIGITGTNGKTTSTYLLKSVLERAAGARVGLIGTIQNMVGDKVLHTERTTPESFELHRLFAEMRDAGCTHVVMEVSSHALVLERVGAIRFAVGAFTNLTEDHLDFHRTMEAYAEAKAILMERCDRAVVNTDDPWAELMKKHAACPVLTYGIDSGAELTARNIALHADGIEFDAVYGGQTCCCVLSEPVDAYEFSFVAVPAQPAAGVMKGFREDGSIQKNAELARRYMASLRAEGVRLTLALGLDVDKSILETMAGALNEDQTRALNGALRTIWDRKFACVTQLPAPKEAAFGFGTEYMI